jgi:hypothetical protein
VSKPNAVANRAMNSTRSFATAAPGQDLSELQLKVAGRTPFLNW